MDVAGKNILITGASGGIGSVIAKSLLEKKANLYLQYHKNKTDFSSNNQVKWLQADFREPGQIEKMFAGIPRLDVLINAVGIEKTSDNPLDLEIWREIFGVNLFGLVKAIEQAVKKMKGGGLIINISSLVGRENVTFSSDSIAYPASKAALNKLAEGITAMYSPKIRTVTISPGYVKTPLWDRFNKSIISECLAMVPSKRFIKPEEIANLALEIINNDAIVGTNFVIDNGLGLKKV